MNTICDFSCSAIHLIRQKIFDHHLTNYSDNSPSYYEKPLQKFEVYFILTTFGLKQLAQEILQQPTHIYYIYIYTKEVFVATTNLKIWQLNLKETGGV